MFFIVFIALVVIFVSYIAMLYNNLVSLKHNITKAWSNIDVLLKQRHDELPKLVASCKEYMTYEQETLIRVMDARAKVASAQDGGDIGAIGQAESMLRQGLGKLFALVENYPDLKADQNFQHLQARITGLEDAIADRREFYNESVNINNIRIDQVPDVFVAQVFKFKAADILEFSDTEIADVDVASAFKQ